MIPSNNEPEIDQKRFILAMIISGVVIVIWQMFFAPEMPTPPPTDENGAVVQDDGEKRDNAEQEKTEKDGEESEPVEDVEEVEEAKPVVPKKKIDPAEKTLETKKFRVKLHNEGARVRGVEILDPEQYQAAGDLLKAYPEGSEHFPYAVKFVDDEITFDDDELWEIVEEESGDGQITFRHVDPDGKWTVEKIYSVIPDQEFQLELEVRVTNQMTDGSIKDSMALDIFGYKDPTVERSFLDVRPDELEAICRTLDDTEREIYGSVDEAMVFSEQPVVWAGIDKRYFLFSAVPDKNAKQCSFETVDTDYLRSRIVQDEFDIDPGEQYSMRYLLVIGPKDQDVLDAAGHKLAEAIDYGFFTFLARPMRWALVNIYDFVGNWGIAILLLTIIIRLFMWPINKKVYENSERMKDIQPQLKKVREKYEDDQQRLAEETMKTFKENNVSALGCAPMFLQFPIFLALYFMILNSVELYQADFMLWYTDLSEPDPYYVLPILMGIVMYAQQSMMQVEGPNPQMQTVMKIMPLTFTVFMLFLPSGVVLYYSASMLLGIAQQFYIKRMFAKRREEAEAAT